MTAVAEPARFSRLRRLLGRPEPAAPLVREASTYADAVGAVNAREPWAASLDDISLRSAWDGAERVEDAFALVRDSARRATGLRAFDVQILGALAMADGAVAE